MYVHVKVRDVIGPIPYDNSALIILWSEGKTFVVPCSLADADMCFKHIKDGSGGWKTPYDFFTEILKINKMSVTSTKLFRTGNSLYSSVFLSNLGSDISSRISSDSPAVSINSSSCSKVPLLIDSEVLSDIIDITSGYESIRKVLPSLWPLSPLIDTERLESFSEFWTKAIPNGSIFYGEKAKS